MPLLLKCKTSSEGDTKTNHLEKIQSNFLSFATHQTTHHVGIMYYSSPGQGKSVVFMGLISLVRYGKYRHQFHLHLHLRSFLASNVLIIVDNNR